MRRSRIHRALVGLTAAAIAGSAFFGAFETHAQGQTRRPTSRPAAPAPLTSNPFGETNGEMPFNASAVVALSDSHFLLCDNKIDDALLELDLDAHGAKAGPLVRHPLTGLAPGAVTDLEGMTLAEVNGRRYVFVTSSLGAKKDKSTGSTSAPPSGLLRVRIEPDGSLHAENIAGFREWLAGANPRLGEAAKVDPDAHGLNVEGLAWDPTRRALLLGVRTPLVDGRPVIVPVRLKDPEGAWQTSNLELLPAIPLAIKNPAGEQGIRDIQYDPVRKRFLVIVGRAVSGGPAPFELYSWDGNARGRVRRFASLAFVADMKPEGVAAGTVGGKRALVFADDRGGYQVVWESDPRLR